MSDCEQVINDIDIKLNTLNTIGVETAQSDPIIIGVVENKENKKNKGN